MKNSLFGNTSEASSKNKHHASFLRIAGLSILASMVFAALGSNIVGNRAYAASAVYIKAVSTTNSSTTYNMYFAVISNSNGAVVKSGFTPGSFSGVAGQSYTITVQDYSTLVFDHWGNGSKERARQFTMGDTNLYFDAYYRSGSSSSSSSSSTSSSTTTTTDSELSKLIPKTGVFVALYMYPSSTGATYWQQVYDQKMAHPSVPFVAAFNPSSGPGSAKDSNIAGWVAKLRGAGVIMIGYTYSNYASRALSAVNADLDKYHNWYGADGVFIDEMTNKVGFESYYSSITSHAKSIGMKMTMGNPGTDVPKSYIGTLTVINITEGVGYIPISWLQYCIQCTTSGWHYTVDKRNFVMVRYGISSLDTTFESNASQWVGLMYIHSGTDSNGRWFNLPSYFGTEVATLDK